MGHSKESRIDSSFPRGFVQCAWGCYVAAACLATAIAGCSGDDNDATLTGNFAGAAGSGGSGAGSGGSGAGKSGAAGATSGAGGRGTAGSAGSIGGGGDAGFAGMGGSGGAAGDVGSGGSGGSAGDVGSGGDGGSGGDIGSGGAGGGGNVFDAGNVPKCSIAIVTNTYDPLAVGCNGIATCRGVIAYMNNSGVALAFPIISFTIPEGLLCTKTHSTSKWVISDDGAASHRCAFTTNPATPWNVAAGNTFRFGYDVIAGATFSPPTDITVSEVGCVPRDGGGDAPVTDALAEGAVDAAPDTSIDAPADAVLDATTDVSAEAAADASLDAVADTSSDTTPEATPDVAPEADGGAPPDASDASTE